MFVCAAYFHIPKQRQKGKFSPRAEQGILVGYCKGNAYCNDLCHIFYTVTPIHCHTVYTLTHAHCHTVCTITPIHFHTVYTVTPIHCHTFYTITPIHRHTVYVFYTPSANRIGTSGHGLRGSTWTAALLAHLFVACPARHGQPYYLYIFS